MKTGSDILILSASSGSGHTRAGEALSIACGDMPGISSVRHIDVLDYSTALFVDIYADLYEKMVTSAPSLWGWWYRRTDVPWRCERSRVAMERSQMRPLLRYLQEAKPDITICTHFLASDIVSCLLQQRRLATRHAVVVTDLHIHALWLCRCFERYFVPTEESAYYLHQLSFPQARITHSGIPINPAFSMQMDRNALRLKHGVDLDMPLILLSAGTFGVESSLKAVKAIMHLKHPANIVVICGKNAHLLKKVRHIGKSAPGHLKFRAFGYIDDMHEWMTISDVFVGKPGGLTLSETMACSLPMVLLNPIPGQETFNTSFLLEQDVAVAPTDVALLPREVDLLLDDAQRLAAMRVRMKSLARPRAAHMILETLLGSSCHLNASSIRPHTTSPTPTH